MDGALGDGVGYRAPMPLVTPGPELTPAERERHVRTSSVAGIGETGMRRLRAARVCVVGAGGLGSPALIYLVGAGVGHLTVVDDDRVEIHNLQRQVLHGTADVGRRKVDSAAERLRALDPAVSLALVTDRLTDATAAEVFAGHHLVLDCTDNVDTRFVIADAAAQVDLPVVWGAVSGHFGQVTVFRASQGFTLQRLWPEAPAPTTIGDVGAFGPLIGAVGAQMAAEAIKLITGAGRLLLGRVLYLDALAGTTAEIPLDPLTPQEHPWTV